MSKDQVACPSFILSHVAYYTSGYWLMLVKVCLLCSCPVRSLAMLQRKVKLVYAYITQTVSDKYHDHNDYDKPEYNGIHT